jgi:PRTRC genetic system protein B
MENITEVFKDIYQPVKALLFYQNENGRDAYIEAYDINPKGRAVNAHPLSFQETIALAESLNTATDVNKAYLKSKGLLPDNVLHICPDTDGSVLWHTKAQEVDMYFSESLQIPCGKASVPPLVWKAGKDQLSVYAVKTNQQLKSETILYAAPFFNLYANGEVCMGTVTIEAANAACLEDFMTAWESYFWNSYFSHLIAGESPVEGNIVQLWQEQVGTGRKFPLEILKKTGRTIKDLIR